MNEQNRRVVVTILGREYRVNCPPSEQDALIRSAHYLDKSMREIKDRGNIHGSDKIAIMAALNITHDLLSKSKLMTNSQTDAERQIKAIEHKIEQALNIPRPNEN